MMQAVFVGYRWALFVHPSVNLTTTLNLVFNYAKQIITQGFLQDLILGLTRLETGAIHSWCSIWWCQIFPQAGTSFHSAWAIFPVASLPFSVSNGLDIKWPECYAVLPCFPLGSLGGRLWLENASEGSCFVPCLHIAEHLPKNISS